jgi:hypothetical protein
MSETMSDLRGSRAPAQFRFGASGKIVALVAVIAGFGALATYAYEIGQFRVPPKPVVSDNQLPTTAAPGQ